MGLFLEHRPGSYGPYEQVLCRHEFARPTKIRIKKPDGENEIRGYGIGESFRYWEHATVLCIMPTWLKEKIELEDGSELIGYTEDFHKEVPWSLKETVLEMNLYFQEGLNKIESGSSW